MSKHDDDKDIKVTMNNGSYGCVFHPAFLPNEKDPEYKNVMKYLGDPTKYVNKFMNNKNARDEIKISSLLMKLDPNFEYLLYPLSYIVKKTNIPKKYIEMCDNTGKDSKKFVSIYMPYGGIDVTEWINKNESINSITKQLSLMKIIIKAIEGLLLLHKNKIVHLDIKPQNMLITEDKDQNPKIKYIDFGFSHFFKDKDEGPVITLHTYIAWPFDYILFNRILDQQDINYYINDVDLYDIYIDDLYIPDGLINSNKINIYTDIINFVKSHTFEDYYKIVDIYMLGNLLNFLFEFMKIKQSKSISAIINGMRNIYPSKRYNDEKLKIELINLKIMLLDKEKELIKKNIIN